MATVNTVAGGTAGVVESGPVIAQAVVGNAGAAFHATTSLLTDQRGLTEAIVNASKKVAEAAALCDKGGIEVAQLTEKLNETIHIHNETCSRMDSFVDTGRRIAQQTWCYFDSHVESLFGWKLSTKFDPSSFFAAVPSSQTVEQLPIPADGDDANKIMAQLKEVIDKMKESNAEMKKQMNEFSKTNNLAAGALAVIGAAFIVYFAHKQLQATEQLVFEHGEQVKDIQVKLHKWKGAKAKVIGTIPD
jgi:hypothetical protein